jgi:hypothetical protein
MFSPTLMLTTFSGLIPTPLSLATAWTTSSSSASTTIQNAAFWDPTDWEEMEAFATSLPLHLLSAEKRAGGAIGTQKAVLL